MVSQDDPQAVAVDLSDSNATEVFDFRVEPNAKPIDLFELTLPRPPQGTWREKFDIRADVRFAHMTLKFDNVFVRVATRGAHLSSTCTGCALLPHSLYGLNPLPSRNVIAVQEKETREIGASASAQLQAKVGGLQVIDGSASLDAKASGEAAHRVERQGVREESVPRVIPRPHGAWELNEPDGPDGCLNGDYLTSGGIALSILGDVFAKDHRAATFLKSLISRSDWAGFKYQVIPALLDGFDSASVRDFVEVAILDDSLEKYERARMLSCYYQIKGYDPNVTKFVKRIFDTNSEPEMRAAAIRARREYGDLSGVDASDTLREIAIGDRDYQVRLAALGAISDGKEQLDFLLERAVADRSEHVRSRAVQAVDRLGYNDRDWFIKIFKDDPADFVRDASLVWLLQNSQTPSAESELRDLLIKEIERADPSYAAARAASIALERWSGDPAIPNLVGMMLTRLPENTGGWNSSLRSLLQRL